MGEGGVLAGRGRVVGVLERVGDDRSGSHVGAGLMSLGSGRDTRRRSHKTGDNVRGHSSGLSVIGKVPRHRLLCGGIPDCRLILRQPSFDGQHQEP